MFLTKNELKILENLFHNLQPANMVRKGISKQIVYPTIKNLHEKGLLDVKLDNLQKVYLLTDFGKTMAWVNYDTEEAIAAYKKLKYQESQNMQKSGLMTAFVPKYKTKTKDNKKISTEAALNQGSVHFNFDKLPESESEMVKAINRWNEIKPTGRMMANNRY